METAKNTYTKEERVAYRLRKKAAYEIAKSKRIRLSLSEAAEDGKEVVIAEAEKAIARLNAITEQLESFDRRSNMLQLIDARYEIQLQEIAIRNRLTRTPESQDHLADSFSKNSSVFIEDTAKLEIPKPIFTDDFFADIIGSVSYNRQTIATHFTDERAAVICSRMSDRYARHIAVKYLQLRNQVQGAFYRYQVHYLANKALKFYGGPVLTFLLGLRPLKFNDRSAYAISFQKPSTDISATDVDFPTLTFTTLKGDKYTLAFHLTDELNSKIGKRPVKIFKKGAYVNSGVHVGSIDSKGFVLDAQGAFLKKLHSASPSLLTFCGFLASSKNPAFYSGVETGNCFVCNRRLTDPISIRYGIGPVCLGRAIG